MNRAEFFLTILLLVKLEALSSFDPYEESCYEHLCMSLCVDTFPFLLGKYLGAGLPDLMVSQHLIL